MLRSIGIYGVISGLVIITINTASLEFGAGQAWLGFLVMFIAFSSIFVAIKQHRDQVQGGVITFKAGLLLGLGIAATASVVYVLIWEVYLAATDYAFIENYINAIIEARRLAGATEAEIAQVMAETGQLRQQYANPLMRLPMTFLEIFPVGTLVSLVSALALRNHTAHTSSR